MGNEKVLDFLRHYAQWLQFMSKSTTYKQWKSVMNMPLAPIINCVERWDTWKPKKRIVGKLLLLMNLDSGYNAELYDTGTKYTLRIYYWGTHQRPIKYGYLVDERYRAPNWDSLCKRAKLRGVTEKALAQVESEAYQRNVELRRHC